MMFVFDHIVYDNRRDPCFQTVVRILRCKWKKENASSQHSSTEADDSSILDELARTIHVGQTGSWQSRTRFSWYVRT